MKKGVTLIELLVSITISSMVFILVGTTLVFFMEKSVKNKRQEVFDQVKNNLSIELTNAVKWAKEVTINGNSLIVDGVTYKFVSDDILKEKDSMLPEEIRMTDVSIQNLSNSPETVSLVIEVGLENKVFSVAKDNLKLVVSQRRTEVSL